MLVFYSKLKNQKGLFESFQNFGFYLCTNSADMPWEIVHDVKLGF